MIYLDPPSFWKRFFSSTLFSIFVLLVLIAGLTYLGIYVANSYKKDPDFGGMITLRQSEYDLKGLSSDSMRLSQSMILQHITKKEVLLPIAKEVGWNVSYEEMLQNIDVKEKLSSQNSFVIFVNTKNIQKSSLMVRALSVSFLNQYRQKWEKLGRENLQVCDDMIDSLKNEISSLKEIKDNFRKQEKLQAVKDELEIRAINEQLVQAQEKFMDAYGKYIGTYSDKRNELAMELELASQIYTDEDIVVKGLKRKLAIIQKRCDDIQKQFTEQRLEIFSLTFTPHKLVNMPTEIMYFYQNVQLLQQQKLALLLPSIIEEKEKTLEYEIQKKNSLKRLLDSNSCDVFIREM